VKESPGKASIYIKRNPTWFLIIRLRLREQGTRCLLR